MAGTETKNKVTPETLQKVLQYDPETGRLTWKPRLAKWFTSTEYRTAQGCANNWNSRHAGKTAFTCVGAHGYFEGRVFGEPVLAHRVAYAVMTGQWPRYQIDHINGDRTDNRWSNLRPCTRTENNRNGRSYGSSGFIGVHSTNCPGSYMARVHANGVTHYLASGRDPEELARLRDQKAKELHGEFACLNFPNE